MQESGCRVQIDVGYETCLALQGFKSNQMAIAQRPFYYKSSAELGQFAFDYQDYETASKYLNLAVDMNPRSWPLLNLLGESRLREGEYKEAINVLNRSLGITSSSQGQRKAKALYLKGKSYLALGYSEAASQAFESSLLAGLNDPYAEAAFRELSTAYRSIGRIEGIQTFDRIIDGWKKDGHDHRVAIGHKGRYLKEIEKYDQALEIFNSLVEDVYPDVGYEPYYRIEKIPILLERADLYRQMGLITKASNDYKRILSYDPENASTWLLLQSMAIIE